MAETYKNSRTTATVSQILFFSCLGIMLPILTLVVVMVSSMDDEIASHVKYYEKNMASTPPAEKIILTRVGQFLRTNSFPFTQKFPFEDPSLQNPPNRSLIIKQRIENLHSVRATVSYAWSIVILIVVASFTFLTIRMHRAFLKLSIAVEQFGDNEDEVNIEVSGPSDLYDLSAGLQNLRLRLQDEKRLQQQVLQHISHEIKTPLTSIREGSTLLDEQLEGEPKEIAHILVKNSDELQVAIENLLDYNSVVASQETVHRRTVSLKELLSQALAKHKLIIRNKKLRIRSLLQDIHYSADATQILSVFDNLISNAIKHSPEGGKISLRLRQKTSSIEFIIEDQGLGVDSGQETEIFEPFYVGKHNMNATLRGTGLGLSIAKKYIEAHGGEIKLLNSNKRSNRKPKGAMFQVTLPLYQSMPQI